MRIYRQAETFAMAAAEPASDHEPQDMFPVMWPTQVMKYVTDDDPRKDPKDYPKTYQGEPTGVVDEAHSPTNWDGSRVWDLQEMTKRHRPEMERELVDWYQRKS